jgi:hypothetical protein
MGLVLLIILILLLLGAFSQGGNWGYGPSGLVGFLLLVVLILLLMGHL